MDQLKEYSPQGATIGTTDDRSNRSADNRSAAGNRTDAANRADASRDDAKLAETSLTRVEDKNAKVDFVQLSQEIANQCLNDSKEMLNSKSGAEFDKCFVGMQVAKHADAISKLTVVQRHTSGKMQELVKANLDMCNKHMEVAVNLMEKLAESDSSKSTR